MDVQLALDLPSTADVGVVVVNARFQVWATGDQRAVVVDGRPIQSYCADDPVAEAYAMVTLVDVWRVRQEDVARAFGCSVRTVRRHQRRYAEAGMAGLAVRCGWRKGRRRLSSRRLSLIERLKADGMSNRAIATRLGVTEAAIRKQVGPREAAEQLEIAFPAWPPAAVPVAPAASSPNEQAEQPASVPEQGTQADSEGRSDAEPVPTSLDIDPQDRRFDRLLACFGLLDDAAPVFANAGVVPSVGVLFALPLLVGSGIFGITRKLYGEIGPAFYGLRTTVLTLLLMALLRVKRAEGLKERDPAALGRLVGLDRAPEMKTLRRKLTQLAACHRAEQLVADLARRRVELRGQVTGFLYVDGHVRVYHGQRKLPKTHVARMRISLPATTDYWVNDQRGDPLLVVTAEANAGLVTMLPELTRDIRAVVGERHVTVVFDRGGWSPRIFRRLVAEGFDILTYRKGACPKVAEHLFALREAVLDGRSVSYRLHDQEISLVKGKLLLRQVTRLCDDGHQTQVVTSRRDLSDVEVAYRMFERWRQENFFKYMREEFLLDALVDYTVEPDDPTRTVPNPARKAVDVKVKAARAEVATLEQAYGAAALANREADRPTMRGFKIAHAKLGQEIQAAKQRLDDLLTERQSTPLRVEVRDVSPGEVVKLASERKRLSDVFKIVAYQTESDLLALLRPSYARADDEGRTLLHELFATSGSIEVAGRELRVTLAPLSSPHRTAAAAALCVHLNKTETRFPGSDLRLVLAVQPDRSTTMAFPGPKPLKPLRERPEALKADTSQKG